ncbi:hypothetical protein PV326_002616 [Microctonus aethiopoides]|nr:hypothetical protein PV326_002616 [Microctonus aethiopoides]
MMQINTSTGKRWSISGVSTHRESVIGIPTSGIRLPTASEPTTHQKIHRIIEEHDTWKSKSIDRNSKSFTSNNCLLPNCNIVTSRRELSCGKDRSGSFPIRGNLIKDQFSGLSFRHHNKSSSCDCQFVNGRGEDASSHCGSNKKTLSSNNNWERRRDIERLNLKTRPVRISKSSSVPANLKEEVRFNPPGKVPIDGILKKNPLFIDKFTNNELDNNNRMTSLKKKNKFSNRRVHGIVTNLKKSPSCQTLNTISDRNYSSNSEKNISSVKKSVSFSSDTSFIEKQTPFNKKTPAIHEARVYSKGVLRDVYDVVTVKKKVSNLSLSSSKETVMSQAFLKAARDADDLALTDLVAKMRRSSLNNYLDVNASDSSGRSAISYIAGNGADRMLEIVLSLPGINPNLPDNEGNTPLHFAAQAGQAESLNILLQRNADIELDARNVLGFTPLMKAALQGRTKCAKILLFAGANPTLRDYGKGLKAEQWARYCGRHVCADNIERFSRHKFMEKNSCRWGSEPELAAKVLQGKIMPASTSPPQIQSSGLRSKIKRVFKSSSSDKSFSLVSQLTNAALCASTPVLPKSSDITPVKSLIRPLIVPQLRVTLVTPANLLDKSDSNHFGNHDSTVIKPSRVKKKNK